MRYTVILERGDTGWGAHVPDLCIAAGETREEALSLIREAISAHIEGLKEQGLPVPEPRSEGDVIEVGAVSTRRSRRPSRALRARSGA